MTGIRSPTLVLPASTLSASSSWGMFGRLQRTRPSSNQPTDNGSSQTSTDPNLPPPPAPQPTGALHPATLTPVSSRTQSYSHRSLPLPPPLPAYGHSQNRPAPPPATGDTRLRGLADAALMDARSRDHVIPPDRRLPPLEPGFRPPYVSQGRFWDESQGGNGKERSASSTSNRYNPYPPIPPIPAYRGTNPPRPPPQALQPASAPTSRRTSPSRPQIMSTTATAPLINAPSPPRPRPPTTRSRSNHKPHPLEGIHLDREYRQPSVDTWEDKAMRVLRLPAIPPAAASSSRATTSSSASATISIHPHSPPLTATPAINRPENQRAHITRSRQALIDPRNPTPPATANNTFTPLFSGTATSRNSTQTASRATSPSSASTSLRTGRGSDKRPRVTPHSSVWANVASQLAPQDPEGRKIHPPPGGIIPPPPQPSRRTIRASSTAPLLDLMTDTPLYPEHLSLRSNLSSSSTPAHKANSEPGSPLDISPNHASPNRSHSIPSVTSPTFLPSPFLAADITSSLSKRKRPPPSLSLSDRPFPASRPAGNTFESHTAARRASTRPQSDSVSAGSDMTTKGGDKSGGVRSGSGSTWYSEYETTSSSLLTGESEVLTSSFPESGPESQKTLVDPSSQPILGKEGLRLGETRWSTRKKGAEREDGDGRDGREISRDRDSRSGKKRDPERRRSQNVESQKRYREKRSERYMEMRRDLESNTTLNRSLQLEAIDLKKRIAELEAALERGGTGSKSAGGE